MLDFQNSMLKGHYVAISRSFTPLTQTRGNVHVDEENNQPEISSESSEIDVLEEKLKALELELKSTKDEYSQFKTAQLEIQKANMATTQAKDELARQRATYKFGVERFTRDNSNIKFYTEFLLMSTSLLFMNLPSQQLKP